MVIKLLQHFHWWLAQIHIYLTTSPSMLLKSNRYIAPTYILKQWWLYLIFKILGTKISHTYKVPICTLWVYMCSCEVCLWPFCTPLYPNHTHMFWECVNIQYQSHLDIPTHSRFNYFLHCRIIVKTWTLLNNISCGNKNSVKQI